MRTDRGLDRFVTFLDAVVAIALTLLVLPLADVARDVGHQTVGQVLSDNAAVVFAYLLSFLVIARFWLSHHRIVEWVGAYDRVFLVANLVWAFGIITLPFSTALTANNNDDRSGIPAFYLANTLLLLVAMSVSVVHVARTPALQRESPDPSVELRPGDTLSGIRDGTVVTTALVALTLVLVLVQPAVSYRPLLLLLFGGLFERLARRVRERRAARR